MKTLIKILSFLMLAVITPNFVLAETTAAKQTPKTTAEATDKTTYTMLQTPTVVVNNPNAYLDKNIQFVAKFNKFSVLGLDYSPALRSSQTHIGILINRDDVGNNIIPLSEFKIFLKRTDAEKIADIESGDSILIKGKVFSVALGDPWLDIKEIKILTPKKKETQKAGK